MHYLFNDYGHYAGTSVTATPNSTTVAPPEDEVKEYCWNHVEWVEVPLGHGAAAISVGGAMASQNPYPTVTPAEFKLLLTSAERVALRLIRTDGADHVLNDFFDLIDDPRLTEVDLKLPSVQEAIGYLISLAAPSMTPPYEPEDVARRVADVLSGVLK